LKVVRLSIAAGAGVPTHASNVDVTAVVVKGKGTFTVEGKVREIAPGSVVDMRPNQSHSLQATSEALELIVLHFRLSGGNTAPNCSA
jgi:quercetin dioxygenase-like cupin family protein